MNNSIRKQLLWGKRHSTIGLLSKLNKGGLIPTKGKIIQSKNGICVKYRSKLTGEIEFEDVDNVYYGIENFSSNLSHKLIVLYVSSASSFSIRYL